MNLTKEESIILRRQVSAVDSLFRKGLLTVGGAHVELSEAGRAWLTADAERIRLAKSRGGQKGGPARAESLTFKQLQKIARKGGRAKAERAKKGKATP